MHRHKILYIFLSHFALSSTGYICESDHSHPMAAIWFLLFNNFKAIMNARSLGVSIPEHWGCTRASGHRKKQLEKRGSLAMLKKQQGNTVAGRIGVVATKAGRLKIGVATGAIVGVLLVTAHVFHLRSLPAPLGPPVPMQSDAASLGQIDDGESSLLGDTPIVGRLRLTTEIDQIDRMESPPPAGIPVGRQSGEVDAPELSTPAIAVYSALALIDRKATDQLTQCCVNGADAVVNALYPHYLGHPIELVNVIEQGDVAKVIWKATVHTGFTLAGQNQSPGQSIILVTRLIRVEGIWKLLRLHDGDEDGPQ